MLYYNILRCNHRISQGRYRLRTDRKSLEFFAQHQERCMLVDKCDFSYLVIDAGKLLAELIRSNATFFDVRGICYFEIDVDSNILYDNKGNVLDLKAVEEMGNADQSSKVMKYDVRNGAYILVREKVMVAAEEYEIPSRRLTPFKGTNITVSNRADWWCSVKKTRVYYAAEMGYDWIFILWRPDEESPLGGYSRIYSCPARELLTLINAGLLSLAQGGYNLYPEYRTGTVYSTQQFLSSVLQLIPCKRDALNAMIREVPSEGKL